MADEKECTLCKTTRPYEEFYYRHNTRDKLTSWCKSCGTEAQYTWREANKEKQAVLTRRANLKRYYGITLEQYDELLEKQEHKCVICDRHEDEFKTRLCVDHNHSTGEIRGLLCNYCNHRVIGRHKDGELLRKMADYVDGGTGWFVPKKKRKRSVKKK